MKHTFKRLISLMLAVIMAFSLLLVPVEASSFTDVSDATWYAEAVDYVQTHGWMTGTGKGVFTPNGEITRAMFVTVLARYAQGEAQREPAFRDVPAGTWYTDAVAWAAEQGIVNGVSREAFAPNRSITRQDLCTMLARYLKSQGLELAKVSDRTFTDAASVSSYAKEAVELCAASGLIAGFEDGTFRPFGTATRAQVAVIMMRLDKLLAGEPAPSEPMPAQNFNGAAGEDMTVYVNAPEGALPEKTDMNLRRLSEEELAEIAEKVGSKVYAAADISFSKDDAEIEPNKAIEVQISLDGLEDIENPTVVHVKDDDTVEIVSSELINVDRSGSKKALRFYASDFSVYAFTGGTDTSYTVEVEFYVRKNNEAGPSGNDDDWTLINKQIIHSSQIEKAKDNDDMLIFDPGVPALKSNQAFEGWWRTNTFDEDTPGMSVEQMNINIKRDYANGTIATHRKLYAMVYDVVYITYHDQAGAVLETESIHAAEGTTSITKKFDRPYTPFKGDQKFFGWITEDWIEKDGDGALKLGDYPTYTTGADQNFFTSDGTTDSTVPFAEGTNNVDVYPYLTQGYWLLFDTNIDKNNDANGFKDPTSATYIGPQLFMATETTPTTDYPRPTRHGYDFGGWYTDAGMTREFTWGTRLTKDTTVYAKWTKASTTYRVVFWQQKASDSVNAAKKTYDYYGSDVRSATTGASVSITTSNSGTTADNRLGGNSAGSIGRMGYYFTYDGTASDTGSVQVKGDGSTVLNVYYNRRTITIYFMSSNSSNARTLYTRSGLYEGPLTNWPSAGSGYRWYWDGDDTYSLSIDWNSYTIYGTTSSSTATTWTMYRDSFSATSPKTTHWIGQDTDGNFTYEMTTGVIGSGSTVYFDNTLFLGFKLFGYNRSTNSTSGTYFTSNTTGGSVAYSNIVSSDVYIYYTRNQHSFVYNSNNSDVKTESVYYQKNLSSYASYVPTNGPEGYYFDGWYADPSFDTKYDFSGTMPNANVTVYAKWTQLRFRTVLNYNGNVTDANAPVQFLPGQATAFRLDYGEQLEEGGLNSVTREGYTLLGWYYRDAAGEEHEFNFAMGANESMADMTYGTRGADEELPAYQARMLSDSRKGHDAIINADWDDTWVADWEDLSHYSNYADEDFESAEAMRADYQKKRVQVRGYIEVYAKWREDPDGVIGMHVQYYANNDPDTGYFAPDQNKRELLDPNIYVDQAEAYAQPASTPDNSAESFLYWEILRPVLDAEGNYVLNSDKSVKMEPSGQIAYPGQTWDVFLRDAVEEKELLPDPKCDHSGPRTHHDAADPTCTEAGNVEYWQCDNCGKYFDAATGGNLITDVTVAPLGHAWGTPTYTWNPAENLPVNGTVTCTGTAVCGNNTEHTITEDATVTWKVDTAPNTSSTGSGHYEATFSNTDAFTTQNSPAVEIPVVQAYQITYTVANGQAPAAETVEPGSAVTLPETWTGKADPSGWTFVGWVQSDVAETTDEQSYLTGSYAPSSDVTFKALYTRTSTAGGTYTLVTADQTDWSGNYVITYDKTTSLYALKGLAGNHFYEGLEYGGTTPYANTGMTLSGSTLTNVSPYYVFAFAKNGDYYTIQNTATANYVTRYVDSTYGAQLTSLMEGFTGLGTYNKWTPTYSSNGNVVLQNYVTTSNTDYPYLGFGGQYFWVDGSDATNVNSIYLWKETVAPGETEYYSTEPSALNAYTVSFSVPGTVDAVNSQTVTAGNSLVLPAANAPTGSYFVGWATSAVADTTTVPSNCFASGALYKPTANVPLYAVYVYYDVYYALQTSMPSSVPGYYVISSGTTTGSYMMGSTTGNYTNNSGARTLISSSGATISTYNGSRIIRNVPDANIFRFSEWYSSYTNMFGIYNLSAETYVATSGNTLTTNTDKEYDYNIWTINSTATTGKSLIYSYSYSPNYYINYSNSSYWIMSNSSSGTGVYLWKRTVDIHYSSSPAAASSAPATEEVMSRSGELVQRALPATETQQLPEEPAAETARIRDTAEPAAVAEPVVADTPAAVTVPDPLRASTTVASWDFETSADYDDWGAINSDGDSYNWDISSTNTATHSGSYALRSDSYRSVALTPDNWVFTSAVNVPAAGTTTMTFWVRAQDTDWPGDIIRVYANSTQSLDGAVALTEDISAPVEWTQVTVDLTAYAGQTIYLAFRHYDSSDLFAVVIDDVVITNEVTETPVTYTVTFVDYDGTELSKEEGITAGETVSEPADPSREEYYFLSWQLNGVDFDFSTPITSNITLKAAYTPMYRKTYTVKLRAVYGIKNTSGKSHIYWYANDGTTYSYVNEKGETVYCGEGAGARFEQNEINLFVPYSIPYPSVAATPEHVGSDDQALTWTKGTWKPDQPQSNPVGLSRENRVFLGWARVETDGAGTTGTAHPELVDESDLYLKWDNGKYYYRAASSDGTVNWEELTPDDVVDEIYADENKPYHDMYAVWGYRPFFVFHSSTGTMEAINITTTKRYDEAGKLVEFKENTYDLTALVPSNCLYGGYYTSFGGVNPLAVQAKANAYVAAASPWTAASTHTSQVAEIDLSNNQTYSDVAYVRYDGSRVKNGSTKFWTKENAYGVENQAEAQPGNAIVPEAGKVYYLKEVPEAYLTTKYLYTYDTTADNLIQDFYMLTLVDDNLYKNVGFRTKTAAETVSEAAEGDWHNKQTLTGYFSVTQRGNSDGSTEPVTVTVNASSFGLSSGFVAFTKDNSLVKPNASFSLMPAWTTLDGVEVQSHGTLKLSVNEAKTSITGALLGTVPVVYSRIYVDTSAPVVNPDANPVVRWESDNSITKLYFFGTAGETWVTMTKVRDNFYVADIPAGSYEQVVVVRCAPGSENTNGFDKDVYWNKTVDITLDRSKNLLSLSSDVNGYDGGNKIFEAGYNESNSVYNP